MDGVINEKSLEGQFEDVNDFLKNISEDIINALKHFKYNKSKIYKSQVLYDCLITENYTFKDILKLQRNKYPIIERLKSIISEIIYDDPFVDENNEVTSCLDFAKENKCCIISFKHQEFFELYINHLNSPIRNCINGNTTLEHFYNINIINESYYYSKINVGVNVKFAEVDGHAYTQDAFDNNGFTNDDRIRSKEKMNKLFDCLEKKDQFTSVAKYLGDKLYEFRCDISNGRIFRLFFIISNDGIQFLNGFVKKSQSTSPLEIENAKNIIKIIM